MQTRVRYVAIPCTKIAMTNTTVVPPSNASEFLSSKHTKTNYTHRKQYVFFAVECLSKKCYIWCTQRFYFGTRSQFFFWICFFLVASFHAIHRRFGGIFKFRKEFSIVCYPTRSYSGAKITQSLNLTLVTDSFAELLMLAMPERRRRRQKTIRYCAYHVLSTNYDGINYMLHN
jgi:hypothetical protein